jgi:hypothetical protein
MTDNTLWTTLLINDALEDMAYEDCWLDYDDDAERWEDTQIIGDNE